MAERSSKRKKKEHDFAVTAYRVFRQAIGEESEAEQGKGRPEATAEERHAAAVILGRRGGKSGGPARAKKLTAEERSDIARRAALARWSRKT
jgi:hypothetical protein